MIGGISAHSWAAEAAGAAAGELEVGRETYETRQASSAWAAKSMSRLHERIGLPEVKHAARVESLDGPEHGSQLPLI